MLLTNPIALALLAALHAPPTQDPAADAAQERGRALFKANCATCHGEQGDGQGVSQLDRPARSFRDGGFSFGNTPEALFRTITNGIPGSPMPAFDHALSDAERRLVAAHVLTLGPEAPLEPPRDTELVVRERPLVVRGVLPPIAEGAVERSRALLVGLPSGLSMEYRTDDVRLLGLRLGAFADRSDWIGRGGTPLKPLGQVVELIEGGDPGPSFALAPRSGVGTGKNLIDLRARLAGTWVRGEAAGITYALETPEGKRVARVEESLRLVPCAVGSGFARRLTIDSAEEEALLVARTLMDPRPDREQIDSVISSGALTGPGWSIACGQVNLFVEKESERTYRMVVRPRPPHVGMDADVGLTTFALGPSGPTRYEEAWFYADASGDRSVRELEQEVLSCLR